MRLRNRANKVAAFISSGALIFMIGFASQGVAHAAGTFTWNGSDCAGIADNCTWSDANNWVGAAAPSGSGDSVVIDTNGTTDNTDTIVDDVSGLALNSLEFINNSSDGNYTLDIGTVGTPNALTIDGSIVQDSTDTSTEPDVALSEANSLALGADSTFTNDCGLSFVGQASAVNPSISLGANDLTFTDSLAGGCHGSVMAVGVPIAGTGNVIYDGADADYQMSGSSTYTGNTDIEATGLPVGLGVNQTGVNIFGPSGTVTVSNSGSADFSSSTDATVNNPIIVAGAVNGSPVTSLSFDCNDAAGITAGGCASAATISVPHLTINGETRFALDDVNFSNLKVDLAGYTDSGNSCVEYLGYSSGDYADGSSNGFLNGPTGCLVSAATASVNAPKTPDTGFALTRAYIATPILGLLLIGSGLTLASKKKLAYEFLKNIKH